MTKPTDHNAKTTLTAPASKATPNTTAASSPLPKTWSEIRVGSVVIAHESVDDGWWEALVTEVRDDVLTLRWRDYPKQPAVVRNRKEVALLFAGN